RLAAGEIPIEPDVDTEVHTLAAKRRSREPFMEGIDGVARKLEAAHIGPRLAADLERDWRTLVDAKAAGPDCVPLPGIGARQVARLFHRDIERYPAAPHEVVRRTQHVLERR